MKTCRTPLANDAALRMTTPAVRAPGPGPAGAISRRHLLRCGIGAGMGAVLASQARLSGQDDPATSRPQPGDLLVRVGDANATPLAPGDIPMGDTQIMAWAMDAASKTVRSASRLNLIAVLRLPPEALTSDTRSRAAEGVIAYTAICTHTGCEVEEWLPDEQALYCPCHSSKFDAKDGARVVDGPAPRPLPALPLQVVDRQLVVAAPFTARVGFERL